MAFFGCVPGYTNSTLPGISRLTPKLGRLPSGSIPSLAIRRILPLAHSSPSHINKFLDDQFFNLYLESNLKMMNMELEKVVPLKHPLRLLQSMRHTLLSTRNRIISAMCIESCKLVGGDVAQAIPTACAFEMILAMVMIHDDLPCMDNADFRRGKPVNHKAFDEATAILAGDALFALAFEHVASQTQNVSPDRIVRVVLELSRATGPEGVQGGQMMDKLSEGLQDMSLSDLEYIHKSKTGSLFRSVVLGGAIVGGGTDDEVERLGRFGEKAGLLIQVMDDIADATKTTEELGKNAGSDAARDNLTFVKLMGIEGAKKYASELLEDCFQELSYFDEERSALLKNIMRYVYNYQYEKKSPSDRILEIPPKMEDIMGLLRIHVRRGIDLAIRDTVRMSSDPYVIVKMGKQKLKTRVVKKNVNPEWNEDLTLSITDPNIPIKLLVYDRDRFSLDDKMGDAEFDIGTLLESLRMCLDGLPGGTIITRVQPNRQNCLAEESQIVWLNDKVQQNMVLRLRNVERGEVELQLEWINIPGSRGL